MNGPAGCLRVYTSFGTIWVGSQLSWVHMGISARLALDFNTHTLGSNKSWVHMGPI
jgi:hypothetical protein